MDYTGEDLLPGRIGQFFIILSLVSSCIACLSYFLSVKSKDDTARLHWKKLARIAFITDAVSVFTIFGILFYLFYTHSYEYFYVYKNSSNSLEFKYIFSAIWSASEGSFLLWALWHAVIGIILIGSSKKWEAGVMTVLSFSQACLAIMMLGMFFFDYKVGSSPFQLFREQMPQLPLFANADYVNMLRDGNDLSPLLQNYWMVIHPPVLFLGFALIIVPFAYSIAGLWTKEYGNWVKPALPWALAAGGILGLGIMMGARWAYESLSFGGYWAWDPVENASLVPWLTLIAGLHTLLIYKHTGRALRTTHLFFIITYILIIYSTFLTRSGILGDTSVHSFADLGMNKQLYLFLNLFIWLPVFSLLSGRKLFYAIASFSGLIILTNSIPLFALISFFTAIGFILYGLKQVPAIAKEEAASSREFWMFIGSLVLFITAVFIIIATSLPVFNLIFGEWIGEKFTMGDDVIFFYNRVVIFVAVILGLLTAISQYLKYKETKSRFFRRRIVFPTLISVVIASLILGFGKINYYEQGAGYLAAIWLAVISSVYALIANAAYIWIGMKGKLGFSGASVAHLGFAMALLGILISSSKKEVLSYNTSFINIDFGKDSKEKAGENLTLIRGEKMDMGNYWVTYEKDSAHPKKTQWYYLLNFESKDGKEKFRLRPNAFVNYKGNEGLMANPDAKHYWNFDIFTYITSIVDKEKNKDTASFVSREMRPGDSLFYSRGYAILQSVKSINDLPSDLFGAGDSVYEATIKVYSKTNSVYEAVPKLAVVRSALLPIADTVIAESLIFQLNNVHSGHADIGIKESGAVLDYVTLKAYKFPFINLLWGGIVFMVMGFIISMIRRMRSA